MWNAVLASSIEIYYSRHILSTLTSRHISNFFHGNIASSVREQNQDSIFTENRWIFIRGYSLPTENRYKNSQVWKFLTYFSQTQIWEIFFGVWGSLHASFMQWARHFDEFPSNVGWKKYVWSFEVKCRYWASS